MIWGTECIIEIIPGTRIIRERSSRAAPASTSSTLAPVSASLRATMQPALPAPTTT
ncbi:hypothetical protein GCM10010329_67880 [Streptomyces spiroverticillatus]|uniref:Uncharacterized protein n=1 Tax=Streptomyces finlayi TaxID=67296 RepID=A0A918X5B0_9ACTN|nr:hypothetical protein GCM10010329_67880 [Streptomyces spiroverticillatus]GHD13037.1 hypothetical protein GCM10010334_70790 [Streptomyces finlayi]